MDGCGVGVLVEQELDVPEVDVVDDGRGHHIVEQPSIADRKLEGAKGEGLAQHEVVGHV